MAIIPLNQLIGAKARAVSLLQLEEKMTPVHAAIKPMTYMDASNRNLHNRGLILEHNNRSYYLNAGTTDTIHIFTKSIFIYVLIINRPLGYIGLDAYYPTEEDPVMTIFLHSDYQLVDVLGSKWKQMSPSTIACKLTDYLV